MPAGDKKHTVDQGRSTKLLIFFCLLGTFTILGSFTWYSNETIHTVVDTASALFATFAGAIAIVRYYSKKSITFLYIGTAFVGTAVLEIYELVMTLRITTPETSGELICWIWLASRFNLSFLLCFGYLAWDRNKKLGKKSGFSESTIYFGSASFTIIILLIFLLFPPPDLIQMDFILSRPLELVPAVFFLLAFLGHVIKGKWHKSAFERWLLYAIFLSTITQSAFMPYSSAPFDYWFNAAHSLKIMSYLAVIIGLCIEMYFLFKQAEKSQAATLKVNSQLENEIEERIHFQEELSRRETQFKALIEASPNALILVDEKTQIVLVNSQAETIFQYDRSELLGKSIDILLPEKYISKHAQHFSNFMKKPQFRPMKRGQQLTALKRDGSEFPVDIGLAPIEHENRLQVLATIVDVSAHYATENALLTTEGRLKAFIDALPDIAFVFNEEGRFLDVFTSRRNNGTSNLANKTVRDLLPQKTADLFVNTINSTIATGNNQRVEYQWPVDKKNNWFEGHTSLLRTKKTGNTEVIWVSYDISDRKSAELELKEYRQELEDLVEQRTVELQRANKKLKKEIEERKKAEHALKETYEILENKVDERTRELNRSNEELKQFAYVASHDLQEPLRKIRSFTELLATRYEDAFDNRAHNYMNYILDGAKRMQTLIRALLSYSRVSRHIDFEKLDLDDLVNQVLIDMEPSIQETGAGIKVSRLPSISANRVLIAQLFQNLIGNALKYRSSRTLKVDIGMTSKKKMWEIYVKDNGIGMEPQFAERIFIIFQRLHNRENYSGTGIGLAICKKVIEIHGGEIRVDTEPGEGSTFYFTLPKNGIS